MGEGASVGLSLEGLSLERLSSTLSIMVLWQTSNVFADGFLWFWTKHWDFEIGRDLRGLLMGVHRDFHLSRGSVLAAEAAGTGLPANWSPSVPQQI